MVLLHLNSGISWSSDYQKGFNAYQRGDFATALREWTPLAEQGNATVQYNLGLMYYIGKGVPRDYETAAKWFTSAAEQGDVSAQSFLGIMYNRGKGVLKDHKTAVKWYTLASEQGKASAQVALGSMYLFGEGVLKNYKVAHMWGNISADSGNKFGSELMERAAKKMTPSQIETAKKLARECIRKKYKGCEESSSPQTTKKISENNIKKRLANLKKLLDAGLITKEEAAEKRKAILDSL